MTEVADNLARNVKQLREGRGLSQAQMAKACGIPRATWTLLESGGANPTLNVLLKVAAVCQVSLEELIGAPRANAKQFGADELPSRRRGDVTVRKLVPYALPGLELERMELDAGGAMKGVPHTPGTVEYLACERGRIELAAAGEVWRLGPGDVVVFRGDQKHAYKNLGRTAAVAYSIVVLTPGA